MSDQDGDGDATRVEVMHRSTTYRGFFRVDRFRLRHRLFAGGMSQAVTREVFERGDAVAVLPYDPVRDAVVLVEQFRIGAFAREQSPWLMEIIAGTIEKGERPDAVARREAQEEAGLELGRLERVLTNFWIYRDRLGQPAPSLDDVVAGTWAGYVAQDDISTNR